MPDNITTETIQAEPVKRFFIEILTRDIELIAAIIELVDNSVDSARSMRGDGSFAGLEIAIETSATSFSIVDTCAGIPLEAARNYVFKIGRPDGVGVEGSIGQFGVGLKRALFKMGSQFAVDSITSNSHFEMELNVPVWEKEPGWNLELKIHDNGGTEREETGTTVIVDTLLPAVSKAFQAPLFETNLRAELESKHREAIDRGMLISLNKRSLNGTPTQLAVSSEPPLIPGVEGFQLPDDEGRDVKVRIVVGVQSTSRSVEDDEPEDSTTAEDDAGWYVFGNGRLLLAADKTPLTGWGGGKANMPLWHNQFSRFRGYVYMEAADPMALPWNTTKTGVETSDPIWLRVQGEMIQEGKKVIAMLNALKNERASGDELKDSPISLALSVSQPQSVRNILAGPDQEFTFPTPKKQEAKADTKTVHYSVPAEDFDAVADALHESSAAAVGRATFYSYLKRYVEFDE